MMWPDGITASPYGDMYVSASSELVITSTRRTGPGRYVFETNSSRKPASHASRPDVLTMKTSHLDEMIEWYGLVLGTQVQFRNEVAAWTSNDEANHRIALLPCQVLQTMPTKSVTTGCTIVRSNTRALPI
jgi:catechol-2,3-dioxygenase